MPKALRIAREDQSEEEQQQSLTDLWVSAQKVGNRKIEWLWKDRIVASAMAILEGQKGVGKSTVCASLVAAITGGVKLHGRPVTKPKAVIWLAGEEDVRTQVRPRLQAAGADLKRVHFPAEDERGLRRRVILPAERPALDAAIRHFDAALVIIDPLSSFVAPDTDLRADQSIHACLDPLADLCHATGCTILLTRHVSKNRAADRIDQGLGGVAVAGVARSVLCIDWPDRRCARRVLRVIACNAAAKAPSLEYVLADKDGYPAMADVKEIATSEDDEDGDLADHGERDARNDARNLLRRVLQTEWVSAKQILTESEGAGISPRTLRSAKGELGVRSRRIGKTTPPHWEWGPPKKGW
jgi:putative DNA primase/helicase